MRIAVDARPGVSAGMTGIGYYTRHLLDRMPALDPGSRYVAWWLDARAVAKPFGRPRRFRPAPNLTERWTPFPATWFETLSQRWELPRLEWVLRFDVLFAPNFVPPPTRSRRLVITVHDLAFAKHPETAPHSTRMWLRRLDRAVGQAAEVITVSEATRADLLERYDVDPARVTAIAHGVDHELFRPPPEGEVARVRERHRLPSPYLLFLGGLEPRKNLPRLVRAFARIDTEAALVIAGSSVPWNPEGGQALRPALEGLPERVRERIVFTGYLDDADKVAILGGAAALAFPSRHEGFGLPVLEAMACGTPVLTSNVSALPEVAGDAALLVDPEDEEAIAGGLARLLVDVGLRERLRVAGLARAARFTWDETARRTIEVLHRAGER